MLHSRNGLADWNEMIRMWVNRMLDPLCDLELWPWPWVFKVKFWKSCIPGTGWQIDIERKVCELIGCQTHFVTLNFDLTHDLDLGFSRSNFKKLYIRNRMVDWHGSKGMWVDEMSGPLLPLTVGLNHDLEHGFLRSNFEKSCKSGKGVFIDMGQKGYESLGCLTHCVILSYDLEFSIFKVKFWKSRIPGMRWPIDMEQKGYESIRCLTHFVTLNIVRFSNSHTLGMGGPIDILNKRDVSWIQSSTHYVQCMTLYVLKDCHSGCLNLKIYSPVKFRWGHIFQCYRKNWEVSIAMWAMRFSYTIGQRIFL